MQRTVSARTPAQLWIVGILSLLWNGWGAYDYAMSRARNTEYLSQGGDPQAILAYMDSMPVYASFGWGLGVWGALLGSVFLLMRSRYAVHAFAASLLGMALSFGAQYLRPMPPAPMHDGPMKYLPLVVVAVGIAQLWYALRERKAGLLG